MIPGAKKICLLLRETLLKRVSLKLFYETFSVENLWKKFWGDLSYKVSPNFIIFSFSSFCRCCYFSCRRSWAYCCYSFQERLFPAFQALPLRYRPQSQMKTHLLSRKFLPAVQVFHQLLCFVIVECRLAEKKLLRMCLFR